MRSLFIFRDTIDGLELDDKNEWIVSITRDVGLMQIYVLTNIGHLYSFDISEDGYISCCNKTSIDLNIICNNDDNNNINNDWFLVSTISETSTLVCISHSGYIVSVKITNINDNKYDIEQEGSVDGGIATAMWSPDQTSLIIVTNNNTILSMTSAWDVINEISYEPKLINSKCTISWRSDGEYFSLISIDSEDSITRIRIYNKYLEFISVGRNVNDGPAAVLKGLSPCVAYGSSGAFIAVAQQRVRQKYQVALLELNGLRHGDFDIRLPPLPQGFNEWEVVSLHWDISTTILAVGALARNEKDKAYGVVQLYTRSNYYWYLKQEFVGTELVCLGFDNEVVGRIYMSQLIHRSTIDNNDSNIEYLSAVRIVDYMWDTYSSYSRDCSVAVIDGTQILLTPLGQCVVPPPMSKYRLNVPAQAIHATFSFSTVNEWNLLILCSNFSLRLFYGGANESIDIDIVNVMQEFNLCTNHESYVFRSSIAIELSANIIAIVILGSRNSNIMKRNESSMDELLILHLRTDTKKVFYGRFECIHYGHVIRMTNWGNDNESIGIGISTPEDESIFNLLRVSILDINKTYSEDMLTLPEVCTYFKIISNEAENNSRVVALGLSSRYRLFCGEKLLVVGVNSFHVNFSLETLLYITVGTRPFLHFMSLSSLFRLDPMEGIDAIVQDCAEPRPLERGARLVASVSDVSKVIIQLPRGNLETFEPRPLTLMQARNLLENKNYLDCLVLLRKQRVDLNLIVDHNPQLFLDNIQQLVTGTVNQNPDLLSLLISSLSPEDVTTSKYILSPSFKRKELYSVPSGFTGDDKVNRTCCHIRDALMPIVLTGKLIALNPCLCTYAKQVPPLNVDALLLIRNVCGQGGLFSSKVQAAIKYLSFLQEGKILFDAALSVCDFEMAKAVARQCQMDPKVYLPLLESFEIIGRGYNDNDYRYALMHYTVSTHLKNDENSINWGLQAMELYYNNNSSDKICSEISDLTRKLVNIVSTNDMYNYALPRLSQLAMKTNNDNFITNTLNNMRKEFGEKSFKNGEFQEAIAAFLSMRPVFAIDAIRAARQGGFWQQALTIAGRYSKLLGSELSTKRVAQEIVEDFKERLEQGESGLFSTNENSVFSSSKDKDKIIEIARISVEYCSDVENAISILTTSKLWINAADIAIRSDRNDLLIEEIGPMVRTDCKETIKLLKHIEGRTEEVVSKLSTLWANPKERLEQVASTEPSLIAELRMLQGQNEYDDTKSEYSLQSNQTGASNLSSRSYLSNTSGTSSVSVLSNLSISSSMSKATTTSSFAIEGLEHGLLSRGNIEKAYIKGKHQKMSKKAEKRRGRGEGGRDVWGLQNENSMCEELWNYGQVRCLVAATIQISEVLLLLGTSQDFDLISQLQTAVDSYTNILMLNPSPVAPGYPPEWLDKRLMNHVKHFQDINEIDNTNENVENKFNNNSENSDIKIETWWETVADGIKYWRTIRKITFTRI